MSNPRKPNKKDNLTTEEINSKVSRDSKESKKAAKHTKKSSFTTDDIESKTSSNTKHQRHEANLFKTHHLTKKTKQFFGVDKAVVSDEPLGALLESEPAKTISPKTKTEQSPKDLKQSNPKSPTKKITEQKKPMLTKRSSMPLLESEFNFFSEEKEVPIVCIIPDKEKEPVETKPSPPPINKDEFATLTIKYDYNGVQINLPIFDSPELYLAVERLAATKYMAENYHFLASLQELSQKNDMTILDFDILFRRFITGQAVGRTKENVAKFPPDEKKLKALTREDSNISSDEKKLLEQVFTTKFNECLKEFKEEKERNKELKKLLNYFQPSFKNISAVIDTNTSNMFSPRNSPDFKSAKENLKKSYEIYLDKTYDTISKDDLIKFVIATNELLKDSLLNSKLLPNNANSSRLIERANTILQVMQSQIEVALKLKPSEEKADKKALSALIDDSTRIQLRNLNHILELIKSEMRTPTLDADIAKNLKLLHDKLENKIEAINKEKNNFFSKGLSIKPKM